MSFEINGENAIVEDIISGNRLLGLNYDGSTVFKMRLMPGVNRVFRVVK